MIRVHFFCIIFLSAITPLSLSANPIPKSSNSPSHSTVETGVLQAEPDYTGDVLGAKIEHITVDEQHQIQIIDIRVPVNPDNVNHVKVLSPSGDFVKQDKFYVIMKTIMWA